MQRRLSTIATLTILALLAFTAAAVLAQGPAPAQQTGPQETPLIANGGPVSPQTNTPARIAAPPQLDTPGVSHSKAGTIGTTEEAYPADTEYLNGPSGLYYDSDNHLHVVEELGFRAIEYDGQTAVASLGKAGLCYTDDDVFCIPQDVAVDSAGNTWVADGNRVIQYAPDDSFGQQLPEDDPSRSGDSNMRFHGVHGIAFDSAGRMYVSDTENHRVQVYSFSDGSPVYSTTIGVTGTAGSDNSHFDRPYRIAIDGSDRLYVVDNGNSRVQQCTYSGGWSCALFNDTLGDDSRGIATDSAENVYIADSSNNRIVKCDSTGACTDLITGLSGWSPDVAVDHVGHVFVSDWSNHVVRIYDDDGTSIGTYLGNYREPYPVQAGYYNSPWGVAIASDGSMYVTEDAGYRLIKLSPDGSQEWTIGQAGIHGSDDDHLGDYWRGPTSVALDDAGNVYVADTANHRIQIFDSDGNWIDRLGVTNTSGSDDTHFNSPYGVAVGPSGSVYVADRTNNRVQKCDRSTDTCTTFASGLNEPYSVAVADDGTVYIADKNNHRVLQCEAANTCTTFAGVTGETGTDFDHLETPHGVTVDDQERVYVVDSGNQRVQIFDAGGTYVDTIGGTWGSAPGRFRNPRTLAVGPSGALYITDRTNHRIEKYVRGARGWQQINVTGFGKKANQAVWALGAHSDTLYASTQNGAEGTEVYRLGEDAWESVVTDGFDNPDNTAVNRFAAYDGNLYAGTWSDGAGAEIWRSATGDSGTWNKVVSGGFGDGDNNEIMALTAYDSNLYAGTWVDGASTHGAQIWRSPTGDSASWTPVVADAFDGDTDNQAIMAMEVYSDALYAATRNTDTGGEVWRTTNGITWTQVYTDGFGDADNVYVSALTASDDYLYAGTWNSDDGAEIWRSSDGTSWEQVVTNGFGLTLVSAILDFEGDLYAVVTGFSDGVEVWRSSNGDPGSWHLVTDNGFGVGGLGAVTNWENSSQVADGKLYVGTISFGESAGRLWKMLHERVFLPTTIKGN